MCVWDWSDFGLFRWVGASWLVVVVGVVVFFLQLYFGIVRMFVVKLIEDVKSLE